MMINLLTKLNRLIGLHPKSIFDYNILGRDDRLKGDEPFLEEAEKISVHFHRFNDSVNKDIDRLSGDLDEDKIKQRKFVIANQVLDEIKALADLGKANKICRADYKILRQDLLTSLFRLFRTYEDRAVLAHSIRILEENLIIPMESQKVIMKMTPMSRWL